MLYASNVAYMLQQTICRLIAMTSVHLMCEEILIAHLKLFLAVVLFLFCFLRVEVWMMKILALDIVGTSAVVA